MLRLISPVAKTPAWFLEGQYNDPTILATPPNIVKKKNFRK